MVKKNNNGNGANISFENKLWEMADTMRGHMDAEEYKKVVLPGAEKLMVDVL